MNFEATDKEKKKLMNMISSNKFRQLVPYSWKSIIPSLIISILPGLFGTFFAIEEHHRLSSLTIDDVAWAGITELSNPLQGTLILIVCCWLISLFLFWLFPYRRFRSDYSVRRRQEEIWKQLETKNGGISNVIKEIENLVHDPEIPTNFVFGDYDSQFFVIGKWYVDIITREIVDINQIAAILGINNAGTFIIYEDKEQRNTMFGRGQWNGVFNLFYEINPYIVTMSDEIPLPDGRVVSPKRAMNKKQHQAIVNIFKKKRAEAQKSELF